MENIALVIQTGSYVVAVLGGAFAVWKHFHDAKEKRLWEKVKFAKQMLDQLESNQRALTATYMIGAWPGRHYQAEESLNRFPLSDSQLVAVLSDGFSPQTRNEEYVRDCFDHLLFHVEQCLGASEQGLVESSQLEPMLITYFVGGSQSVANAVSSYARHLGYQRAALRIPSFVKQPPHGPAIWHGHATRTNGARAPFTPFERT